ncbi:MAG: response regulator transcription factor [Leptolyngbya sp.]|nr:response regulator transcription factor [Candidatus Melainabacteria bacterium]
MAKILVIEDDPLMAKALQECLEADDHRVESRSDGLEGFELLKFGGFDLALIDRQLPSMEGTEICQQARTAGCKTPILMLTQLSAIRDKASGLDAGADDYLSKPFDAIELLARVRALLRRSTSLFDNQKQVGRLSLNAGTSTLTIDGRTVQLLPREFQILEFFMRHPNTYFTVEQLIKHVWNSSTEVGNEAVKTCISRLRSKVDLRDATSLIETSKGLGYKLSETFLKAP